MTLEEVQKAFPIGSLVFNERDFGRHDTGRVTKHMRYTGGTRDGFYYVCWGGGGRNSWPEFLTVVKPLSALELAIEFASVSCGHHGQNWLAAPHDIH